MSRKTEIQNAYKYLGREATFYDGMITCSTIPGKAVCKAVWNRAWKKTPGIWNWPWQGSPKISAANCWKSL